MCPPETREHTQVLPYENRSLQNFNANNPNEGREKGLEGEIWHSDRPGCLCETAGRPFYQTGRYAEGSARRCDRRLFRPDSAGTRGELAESGYDNRRRPCEDTGKGKENFPALADVFVALDGVFPALPGDFVAFDGVFVALADVFGTLADDFVALDGVFPALPRAFVALDGVFGGFDDVFAGRAGRCFGVRDAVPAVF